MKKIISILIDKLKILIDSAWYIPLISFLAFIDNLIIIIPNDGILVSSTILKPKKWIYFSFNMAIGSTLGALLLAFIVEYQGLPWIESTYSFILNSKAWVLTQEFFTDYGLIIVLFVSLTPIMQHPAVILAALANTPLIQLGLIIFTGRLIKFLIMAYIASHAPKLLSKMWGVQEELKEVGIKVS